MTYREYKKAALVHNLELRKEYETLASQYKMINTRIENKLTQTRHSAEPTIKSST